MLKTKFKRGATSIYVVVISTLLFSVITVSFVRIIINEINRTTSDELAQSAYDSALAGVEDAKTALKKYYECSSSTTDECNRIKSRIEEGFRTVDLNPDEQGYGYCDAVSQALGHDEGEVIIQEKSSSSSDNENNLVQAYTCVIIDDTLADYRSTLNSANSIRVIPLKTEDVAAIKGLRISWYTEDDGTAFSNLNYSNQNSFNKLSEGTPVPPTLSAQIIQTANNYTLDSFDNSDSNGNTNRGTVILVPTKNDANAKTHIDASILADSNNHDLSRTTTNQPQKIACQENEFACSVSVSLPEPIGGARNGDTFFLVLSLPYGQPTTTFSVQLCKDSGGTCEGENTIAEFKGAQISVDSTGRANDMYSRVEARIEFSDVFFPYPEFAIQAIGSGDDAIKKNFYVTENCIKSNGESCVDTGDAK